MNARAFTLLEVLVAVSLLAIAGATLARAFTSVTRAAVFFERLRRAEVVATSSVEAALTGTSLEPSDAADPWSRTVSESPFAPGLRSVSIVVTHRDDARVSVTLAALVPQP